jgi:hypothetical protein
MGKDREADGADTYFWGAPQGLASLLRRSKDQYSMTKRIEDWDDKNEDKDDRKRESWARRIEEGHYIDVLSL